MNTLHDGALYAVLETTGNTHSDGTPEIQMSRYVTASGEDALAMLYALRLAYMMDEYTVSPYQSAERGEFIIVRGDDCSRNDLTAQLDGMYSPSNEHVRRLLTDTIGLSDSVAASLLAGMDMTG